jgi:hypothetical protein
VEAAAPAFDPERGDHELGDRANTTMRSDSKPITLGTTR